MSERIIDNDRDTRRDASAEYHRTVRRERIQCWRGERNGTAGRTVRSTLVLLGRGFQSYGAVDQARSFVVGDRADRSRPRVLKCVISGRDLQRVLIAILAHLHRIRRSFCGPGGRTGNRSTRDHISLHRYPLYVLALFIPFFVLFFVFHYGDPNL